MNTTLEKLFGFDSRKHSVRTEIMAGITTFLTMAYILAVNPAIFSALPGMPAGSVFTATALAAIIGTVVMALYAKKPFALAPGMGLNAFFVYTVCLGMGYSWQFALTAVLLEGIIFIILTVTKVRSLLLKAIPGTLNKAIGAGIGLFIAFIGMQNSGIITNNDATLVSLGHITQGTALLAMIGLFITAGMVMAQIRGGILWGILITTLLGLVIKDPTTGEAITKLNGLVSTPDSVAPIFMQFEWNQVLSFDMLVVVFTFLFIDMFDTMGTIIGVHQGGGMVDQQTKRDDIPGMDKMFMADSIATVCGACLGTSTTTTYVESASGVGEGGRTGLTSFTVAMLFLVALFFSPVFLMIPAAATTSALFLVGVMMLRSIIHIDFIDFTESMPCFVTMLMMPFTASISEGIVLGLLSYVLVKILTGRYRELSITMYILAAFFVMKYVAPLLS